VAFFPQLVAGPIERPDHLIPQLGELKGPGRKQIREGFGLVIWGYFLKMFIADNMARIVDIFFSIGRERVLTSVVGATDTFLLAIPGFNSIFEATHAHLTGLEITLVIVAFAMQIYGDFAGYSNIARGLSKLLGIELRVNFRQPYLASSPADFWHRWHISLSTWLRDYLYIPLGGNRKGAGRTLCNLFLTMLLGGLWHGAAWTYVIWGAYHGLLLALQRIVGSIFKERFFQGLVWRILVQGMTLILVGYGWLIFRANSFQQLKYMTIQLFTNWSWIYHKDIGQFKVYLFWVILFIFIIGWTDIIQERREDGLLLRFDRFSDYFWAGLIVFLILMFGGAAEPFIYFQF